MIVNNYITEDCFIEVKVCNICELPIINEEVANNSDICEDCFWNLDIHDPNI